MRTHVKHVDFTCHPSDTARRLRAAGERPCGRCKSSVHAIGTGYYTCGGWRCPRAITQRSRDQQPLHLPNDESKDKFVFKLTLFSMRAVLVKNDAGPADSLYIGQVETPVANANEVLVKVKAFGLNRMDIHQREGHYPPPPGSSTVLGVEFSGQITSVGTQVTRWNVGDEVLGLAGGGAYAEYIVVPQTHIVTKPAHLTWAEAAAIPENFLTGSQGSFLPEIVVDLLPAFQAIVLCGEIKAEDNVLVHAGASGVGIAAIQLARFYQAKTVTATASTSVKLDFLRSISNGATHTANYKTQDFSQVVLEETTGGKGVDVLVDFVGQSHFEKNLNSLAMDGRMTLLAFLSGPVVPSVNLATILRKRLRIQGSTLRSRTPTYQSELIARFEREILEHITGQDGPGEIKTYIHKASASVIFPWSEIQAAHREMEADANIGKIIAEID
ncbi:PKS-ER domain-containing protein [Mycena indigotica]|uniref:PKS-ER domain-containing protein n=1 Tax=Mycena indigotica TaxID=2126181 RepID=A0A8H6W510_9AGAR|nr:PKS-ER domain-containing protein [Mycena indigotica]KAF7299469.1 PKS-ER domain-containing protein [Mycena indigotica]